MNKKNNKKRNKMVTILKYWASSGEILAQKHREYGSIINLYEKGRRENMVSEDELCSYKSMAEELFKNIRDYEMRKNKIEQAIDGLDVVQRELVKCRYGKKIKWDKVPAHLPFKMSIRQCYREHNKALESLAANLDFSVYCNTEKPVRKRRRRSEKTEENN